MALEDDERMIADMQQPFEHRVQKPEPYYWYVRLSSFPASPLFRPHEQPKPPRPPKRPPALRQSGDSKMYKWTTYEVFRKTRVSRETLCKWARNGLVSPRFDPARPEAGFRWSDDNINRVFAIRHEHEVRFSKQDNWKLGDLLPPLSEADRIKYRITREMAFSQTETAQDEFAYSGPEVFGLQLVPGSELD